MRKLTAILMTVLMIGTALIPAVSSAEGAVALTVNDITENENAFGRCVVPAGYDVVYQLQTCTLDQSVAYPNMLMITAGKTNGPQMVYISARDYFAQGDGTSEELDGQFNLDYQTPLLHYMRADEYNDYIAEKAFSAIADNGRVASEGSRQFPEVEEAFRQIMEPRVKTMGTGVAGILYTRAYDYKTSVWMNGYSFMLDGVKYYALVLTANAGVWMLAEGYASVSWVNWVVPFTYIMLAPESDTEAMDAFIMFVNNTRTSDQFDKANENMSEALWTEIKKAHDIRDGYNYASRAIREGTAEGSDYNEERVTDYIFDRNDYTLEDGSHVKVSTDYSYVWEGDNGNIYVSNSLFDQPGGSRQLYPNP